MAPIAGDIADAAERTAWKFDAKYGVGMLTLGVLAVVLWLKSESDGTYIRDTMASDSKAQTKVIEQNSIQLQQNSTQLQQNSEVLKGVLENNRATMEVVHKALDTIADQTK